MWNNGYSLREITEEYSGLDSKEIENVIFEEWESWFQKD